ncbi:uncharacterized protein LAESUDRAFT_815231 [Laetiporus sulphureus 93-53]|uniref:ARID domain-containing protein n=1 Tax=Laetiporus sulphureus 93-53 TaxID=1314785 RepID=A0A165CD54_9APHY|nr:uncharacterized protein LAESUDRAFT_815231 [Laetiporus sulphureus 93-53]KZT02598.1 hypothetical protein LAESUDRAFT_815231 [Laetiporus sulphureus 93-53]
MEPNRTTFQALNATFHELNACDGPTDAQSQRHSSPSTSRAQTVQLLLERTRALRLRQLAYHNMRSRTRSVEKILKDLELQRQELADQVGPDAGTVREAERTRLDAEIVERRRQLEGLAAELKELGASYGKLPSAGSGPERDEEARTRSAEKAHPSAVFSSRTDVHHGAGTIAFDQRLQPSLLLDCARDGDLIDGGSTRFPTAVASGSERRRLTNPRGVSSSKIAGYRRHPSWTSLFKSRSAMAGTMPRSSEWARVNETPVVMPALPPYIFEHEYMAYRQRNCIALRSSDTYINDMPIDLYKLHLLVATSGGFFYCMERNMWLSIASRMDLWKAVGSDRGRDDSMQDVSRHLQDIYSRYLLGFDEAYMESMSARRAYPRDPATLAVRECSGRRKVAPHDAVVSQPSTACTDATLAQSEDIGNVTDTCPAEKVASIDPPEKIMEKPSSIVHPIDTSMNTTHTLNRRKLAALLTCGTAVLAGLLLILLLASRAVGWGSLLSTTGRPAIAWKDGHKLCAAMASGVVLTLVLLHVMRRRRVVRRVGDPHRRADEKERLLEEGRV